MTGTTQLALRLSPADRARVVRASDLRGVSVATFMRDAVLGEAERAIAADLASATLSAGESQRFLAALNRPFVPVARLKRAMDRGLVRR
jgi:uncharacterized protein (DUF1778 family)